MFTTESVGTYRIHEKNSCGSSQIQAHATSCKWQQKHCWWTGTSVGKALYSSGPGLLHHPPVQPDKSEAFFVKRLFDEIQKWRELRNYKAFCRGILILDGTQRSHQGIQLKTQRSRWNLVGEKINKIRRLPYEYRTKNSKNYKFASLCDWTRKLKPPSRPITWQNKTNGGLVASVFPRFSQFGFHSYTTKHCL